MNIKVTPEIISLGIRADNKCCPVAIAIRRSLPTNFTVSVGAMDTLINGICWLSLPAPVSLFIKQFDNGLQVSPIEFELELDKLINNQDSTRNNSELAPIFAQNHYEPEQDAIPLCPKCNADWNGDAILCPKCQKG